MGKMEFEIKNPADLMSAFMKAAHAMGSGGRDPESQDGREPGYCKSNAVFSALMVLEYCYDQESGVESLDTGFTSQDLVGLALFILQERELDAREAHILESLRRYGRRKDLLDAAEIEACDLQWAEEGHE